jgi:hypothetical protein
MRRISGFAILVLLPLLPSSALARDYGVDVLVSTSEEIYELMRTGELDEEAVDSLVALIEQPLDLNRADRNVLYELPDFTYELADAVVAYRSEHGAFVRLEDLLLVPGVTKDLFGMALPFIVIGPGEELAGDARSVRGAATAGTIVRQGFGLDATQVDPYLERDPGPQTFLKADFTGMRYFGGGFLGTWRERTTAAWDEGQRVLTSAGPANRLDLDSAYLSFGYENWNIVAGSYDVGFGERLTFDSGVRRDPRGWTVRNSLYQDNVRGSLRYRPGQFGGAVNYNNFDIGSTWLDSTLFASTQALDVYMSRGLYFVADPVSGKSCPTAYSWDDGLQVCRSSRVQDEDVLMTEVDGKLQGGLPYLTLKDAMRESIVGGNLTLNLDEDSRLGLTAYQSWTQIELGDGQNMHFSDASTYPDRSPFGAVGLSGHTALGPVTLSGESAMTGSGGIGAFVRAIGRAPGFGELSLSLRYYDARYENPHGHGEAQGDMTGGLAARNEAGARLSVVLKPLPRLRSTTVVDSWRAVQTSETDAQGTVRWRYLSSSPMNLQVSERLSYGLTSKETGAVLLRCTNKDITQNGPTESYSQISDSVAPAGESWRLQGSVTTSRVPQARLTALAAYMWQGTGKGAYDTSAQFRLRGVVRAWEGGLLVGSVGYWVRSLPSGDIAESRERPAYDGFIDLTQRFLERFAAQARYGLIRYRNSDSNRYSWYQLAKLSLTYNF